MPRSWDALWTQSELLNDQANDSECDCRHDEQRQRHLTDQEVSSNPGHLGLHCLGIHRLGLSRGIELRGYVFQLVI